MPKTNINDIVSDGWRAEVSWRAEEYVCLCGTRWASRDQAPTECPECGTTASITPGHVQVASVNQHSKFEFPPQLLDHGPSGEEKWDEPEPFDGWRVTLGRAGIDRAIQALTDARGAAFPHSEDAPVPPLESGR